VFEREREAKGLTDYTGLKIGAILLPVLLLFAYFGKEDMGLAVLIVLAGYCCSVGAPRPIGLYDSMAARKLTDAFLYAAIRTH
jgi:hypothetical protein